MQCDSEWRHRSTSSATASKARSVDTMVKDDGSKSVQQRNSTPRVLLSRLLQRSIMGHPGWQEREREKKKGRIERTRAIDPDCLCPLMKQPRRGGGAIVQYSTRLLLVFETALSGNIWAQLTGSENTVQYGTVPAPDSAPLVSPQALYCMIETESGLQGGWWVISFKHSTYEPPSCFFVDIV